MEIPEPWSYSNCYLFDYKSFKTQNEAKKFCQTAFGGKYIGELAYGIYPHKVGALDGKPKWYYHLKLGILNGIGNFTCPCRYYHTTDIDYIGLKKSGKCPMMPEHDGSYCSAITYNISTVCALSGKMAENE